MVKFVHSADWQLGMTRHYLSDEAQARFSAARLDVIQQIENIAIEEGCEFVVVCGDVFESNQVQRQVLVRALEKMAAIPKVTFFLLPGNHDPLDASSIYRSSTFTERQPDNVKVLDGPEPVPVVPGVELIPAPWRNKHPTTDLVDAACKGLGPTDAVRIVVGHGAIDSMSPSPDDPKLIAVEPLEERIKSGLVHYAALGDRHSTTDVGATGRVRYAGAPEPTDYTETDPGNVLVVDLDADNMAVDIRHLGTWRFVRGDWQLSADKDIDALEEWLSGLDDKDRTIVKGSVVGQVSVGQKDRLVRRLGTGCATVDFTHPGQPFHPPEGPGSGLRIRLRHRPAQRGRPRLNPAGRHVPHPGPPGFLCRGLGGHPLLAQERRRGGDVVHLSLRLGPGP